MIVLRFACHVNRITPSQSHMQSLATMARRNPARPGEQLKDALITVDAPTWEAFKRLMRNRDTSASAQLREYMARQVRAAGRRTNA